MKNKWDRLKGSFIACSGFFAIIAFLVYFFYLIFINPLPATQTDLRLNHLDLMLKILGVLAALGFFVYKIHTGWLIVNLKVSIKLDRTVATNFDDLLAITSILEKGSTDSIWIEAVSARVRTAEKVVKTIDMSDEFTWVGFPSLTKESDESTVAVGPELGLGAEFCPANYLSYKNKFDWSTRQIEHVPIALSPGEATSISRFLEIPCNFPIAVDIAIWGKRTLWSKGSQWRASAVSLPLAPSFTRHSARRRTTLKS